MNTATIVKTVFIILLCALAFYLRDILLVMIAAVVLASSIEPSVKWFIARRIPRTVAVLLIYLLIAAIFAGTFYFLLLPLLDETQDFVGALPDYINKIDTFRPIAEKNLLAGHRSLSSLSPVSFTEITQSIGDFLGGLSQGAFSTASAVLGGLLNLVLIIVLSFYLAVQQDGISNFLRTISPSKHRKYVVDLWTRSENKIGLWMQGQLLLGVIVAVLVYLGLALLGVKHALLLGFLAGVFELIPLFGPMLSAIPGITLAVIGGGFTMGLLVAGFYLIVQQFESQLIYPLVVKKVVGVPPIISIIALVVGARLAGFLGLLLAVPVAAILMEFFKDIERDRINEERVH